MVWPDRLLCEARDCFERLEERVSREDESLVVT